MSTKTRGELEAKTPAGHWYYNNNTKQTSLLNTYQRITSSNYESSTGTSTPNFVKRKKRGDLIPFTTWTQFKSNGKATGHWDYTLSNGDRSYSSGNWPAYGTWLSITPNNIGDLIGLPACIKLAHSQVTIAAGAIYSKGFDGLTFLAELHKTVDLFRNLIGRASEIARRGALDRAWLEGRYGWRLLVYDIRNINELIQSLDDQRTRHKQRVGAHQEHNRTFMVVQNNPYSGDHYYQVTETVVNSVRGNVVADIKPPKIAFNVPKTLWELTRWSFVIDWFIQVGSWLDAMSFLTLNTGYVAAAGVHSEITRHYEYDHSDTSVAGSTINSWAHSSTQTVTYTHRVPSSVSNIPPISTRLNAAKVADLVALLVSALRR